MVMFGPVYWPTLGPPLKFLFCRWFNYNVDPSPPIILPVNWATRNAIVIRSLYFPKQLTIVRNFPKFKLLIPEIVYAKALSVHLQIN